MSFDGLVTNSHRPVINGYTEGPALAFPCLYVGNYLATSLELDETFGKSTARDDETPMSTVNFGSVGEAQDVEGFKNAKQCFKRINLEVAHFPSQDGKLCPDPEDPSRMLEAAMWDDDAAQRIQYNFLFNLETLDLYCGGAGNGKGIQPPKIDKLGRVGAAKIDYYNGPFPARGLPIKFQKVYFYGTHGQISGSDTRTQLTKPFNNRAQSDGRGALFSTYILCASTAVNSLNRAAGNDGVGYMPEELSSYDLAGGTFTYLKEPRYSSSDFFLDQKDEYNEGIDVEWDPENYSTDAPLIIGDGALGFREETLGKEVFGKVDTYEVTEASKYYEQQITLCIDGDNITGTILFKPVPSQASSFSESDSKMLIHNMRNTFSCTGIVPTGDCEDGDCLYEGGRLTPLPYQHEKVQILDETSILLRTDAAALAEITSTNKCASD